MYELILGDRHDTEYKVAMNALMQSVFGFTFDRWYAQDLWDHRYECYSMIHDGRIISNVSMTKMTVLVEGRRVRAIQLGAVATLPEYRGHGLARRIIEHVLDKYRGTPAFLFANETVLGFYPKFGFEQVNEAQPYLRLSHPLHGEGSIKLPVDSPILAKHVENRRHFSAVLDVLDAESINWFHILMEFSDDVYYIPQLDTVVIATGEDHTVMIYDVLGVVDVPLAEILRCLPFQGYHTIQFAFTPDFLGCDYKIERLSGGGISGHLFCRGLDLKGDFKFPHMATT